MATNKKRDTYLQAIIKQGYSRRDFMKFTTFMAAYMGLQNSAIGKITKALETTPRLPVIWEHYQECTCCSAGKKCRLTPSSANEYPDVLYDDCCEGTTCKPVSDKSPFGICEK